MPTLLTYSQAAEVLSLEMHAVKNRVSRGLYATVSQGGRVYVDWDGLSERVRKRGNAELALKYGAENAREQARVARQSADTAMVVGNAATALQTAQREAMRLYRKPELHAWYRITARLPEQIADDLQAVAAWMLWLANDATRVAQVRPLGFVSVADCYDQVAKHLRSQGYHNCVITGDGRRFRERIAPFALPATMHPRTGAELVGALGDNLGSLISGKLGNKNAEAPAWHRDLFLRLYLANRPGEGARLDAVEVQARYGHALEAMLQDAREQHGDAVREADYWPASVRTIQYWITEARVLTDGKVMGKGAENSLHRPHHHRERLGVNTLWSGDGWYPPALGGRKLWVWYDAATYMALGWAIAPKEEGESTRLILAALRHAYERVGVLPPRIQVDYSMTERDDFAQALERMGIAAAEKEAGKPQSSYAERNNRELGKNWKRYDENWVAMSANSPATKRRREDIDRKVGTYTMTDIEAMVQVVMDTYNGTPRPVLGLHPDRRNSRIQAERYYAPAEAWAKQGIVQLLSGNPWAAYYLSDTTKATINRGDLYLTRDGQKQAYRLSEYWDHIPARQDRLPVVAAFDAHNGDCHLFHQGGGSYIGVAPLVQGWQEGDKESIAAQSKEVARFDRAKKDMLSRATAADSYEARQGAVALRNDRKDRGVIQIPDPRSHASPRSGGPTQHDIDTPETDPEDTTPTPENRTRRDVFARYRNLPAVQSTNQSTNEDDDDE